MIQSFRITNHVNETLDMILTRPELSGFAVVDVRGLGPANANISMTDYSTIDGAAFNSARAQTRNIVFSLRLLGTPSIEKTRHKAYRFFPVKKRIKIEIETDQRKLQTYGYVESAEPNIFSSEEAIDVSIICPDPMLQDQESTKIRFFGAQPLFEFPFENAGSDPMLEVGSLITEPTRVIEYTGDSDVGLEFHLLIYGNPGNIDIYHIEKSQTFHIDADKIAAISGAALQNGDEIIVNTKTGEKSMTLLRNGLRTNIINAIDRSADWIRLDVGTNTIAYAASASLTNVGMELHYNTSYLGV